MIAISILNQKGGVGKSTTSRNLGEFFANQGFRTLLVDVDAQANLTQLCKISEDVGSTIRDVFTPKAGAPPIYSIHDKLDIIPSSLDFAGIELVIIGAMQREMFIVKALKKVESQYDICLIDCPPAINLVTTNALAASDWVLIPMEASLLSFNGLSKMLELITAVRENLNPEIAIIGTFFTKFTSKTIVSREILQMMESNGYKVAMLNSKIRQYEDFRKAENQRESIFEYSKSSLAAADYRNLGHEIIEKLNLKS